MKKEEEPKKAAPAECKLEKYQDKRGHWRWRFKAKNGRNIASSGEGYVNEADCNKAIQILRREFAEVKMFRIKS